MLAAMAAMPPAVDWREERAALITEWKARLAERETELKEQIADLKEKHRADLDREREEWKEEGRS